MATNSLQVLYYQQELLRQKQKEKDGGHQSRENQHGIQQQQSSLTPSTYHLQSHQQQTALVPPSTSNGVSGSAAVVEGGLSVISPQGTATTTATAHGHGRNSNPPLSLQQATMQQQPLSFTYSSRAVSHNGSSSNNNKHNTDHFSTTASSVSASSASNAKHNHTMMSLQIEDVSPDLSFVWRLYLMLRDSSEKFPEIVRWCNSEGTAFEVLDPKKLESNVLTTYFSSSKYDSFTRNLRGYGFTCLSKRRYTHKNFRRDDPASCDAVVRVKGKKKGKASSQSSQAKAKTKSTATAARRATSSPVFSINPLGPLNFLPTLMNIRTAASPSLSSISSASGSTSSSHASSSTPVNHPDTCSHQYDMEPIALDDLYYDTDDLDPIPFSDEISGLFSEKQPQPTAPQDKISEHQKILQDLEPRTVEEIAARPKNNQFWLSNTPVMTPEINQFIEYLSPVSLPAGFKFLNLSRFGIACGAAVTVIHAVECLLTSFGGKTWCLQPRIGRIQHLAMDQVLNHGLISLILLAGPGHFGPAANMVGMGLCQTLPIFAMSTEKTHFDIFVRTHINASEERILEGYLDRLIRNTFVWYQTSYAMLAIWYFMDLGPQSLLLAVGLFLFNLVPFLSSTIYWRYIGSRSLSEEPLPSRKDKNA